MTAAVDSGEGIWSTYDIQRLLEEQQLKQVEAGIHDAYFLLMARGQGSETGRLALDAARVLMPLRMHFELEDYSVLSLVQAGRQDGAMHDGTYALVSMLYDQKEAVRAPFTKMQARMLGVQATQLAEAGLSPFAANFVFESVED
jgi:hypothetical protein